MKKIIPKDTKFTPRCCDTPMQQICLVRETYEHLHPEENERTGCLDKVETYLYQCPECKIIDTFSFER